MASITIKNLPDSIHGALKERALLHGRSLNGEVISCLRSAVSVSRIDFTKVLESVDRVRSNDSTQLDPMLLKTAIEEGRP